jgi:hypothetical protein
MSAFGDLVGDSSGICELADISGGNTEVASDLPDTHISEWSIFGQICTSVRAIPPLRSVDYSTESTLLTTNPASVPGRNYT